MRKPVIVGNWKMNMTVSEAEKLLEEIKNLDLDENVEAGVCTCLLYTSPSPRDRG